MLPVGHNMATPAIAYNAGKAAIQSALTAANTGITGVTVSDPVLVGNDRIFTITLSPISHRSTVWRNA